MKGATSWGPRAWVSMSASASAAACPTKGRREKRAQDHAAGSRDGQVLRADPDGDRQQDARR